MFILCQKLSQVETYSKNKITRNFSKHIHEFMNGLLSRSMRTASSDGTKMVTFFQYICISKHTGKCLMCVNITKRNIIILKAADNTAAANMLLE
jgi:hypothetical protein